MGIDLARARALQPGQTMRDLPREAFFSEYRSVVRRFRELCQESLAQRGIPREDFIYLLQSARSFDGDQIWGRKLDQLAGGELSGNCPQCTMACWTWYPEITPISPSRLGFRS